MSFCIPELWCSTTSWAGSGGQSASWYQTQSSTGFTPFPLPPLSSISGWFLLTNHQRLTYPPVSNVTLSPQVMCCHDNTLASVFSEWSELKENVNKQNQPTMSGDTDKTCCICKMYLLTKDVTSNSKLVFSTKRQREAMMSGQFSLRESGGLVEMFWIALRLKIDDWLINWRFTTFCKEVEARAECYSYRYKWGRLEKSRGEGPWYTNKGKRSGVSTWHLVAERHSDDSSVSLHCCYYPSVLGKADNAWKRLDIGIGPPPGSDWLIAAHIRWLLFNQETAVSCPDVRGISPLELGRFKCLEPGTHRTGNTKAGLHNELQDVKLLWWQEWRQECSFWVHRVLRNLFGKSTLLANMIRFQIRFALSPKEFLCHRVIE